MLGPYRRGRIRGPEGGGGDLPLLGLQSYELSARGPLPPTGNRRHRAHPACRERCLLPARSVEAHGGSRLLSRGQQPAVNRACPAGLRAPPWGRGRKAGMARSALGPAHSRLSNAAVGFWLPLRRPLAAHA